MLKTNKNYLFLILSLVVVVVVSITLINVFTRPSVEEVKDSVVMIEVYDENDKLLGTGSGFSVYKENYIATNFHVIEGGKKFKIITDDKKYHDVEDILIFDYENDLALIKANIKLKPIKLGNTRNLKAGNKVTAIGSPKGQLNTVSTGIISNSDEDKYIRITAPISPGSSGGVLLDKNNSVIGITSAVYNSIDAQNINYAVSVDYLEKMYGSYKKGKYYEIKNSNLDRCLNNSENIISFNGCEKSLYDYYRAVDIEEFYKATSPQERYNNFMDLTEWSEVYDDSSIEVATSYYKELIELDFCKTSCDIPSEIKEWNSTDFIINLNILREEELAFVLADLENYSSDEDKFYRVEEYPLEAYQKALILYLIGNRDWVNIHDDNKEDIFDFFDSEYGTEDLGAILEILGYRVVYEDDGTLTAYW